jgi:hypothetical protein
VNLLEIRTEIEGRGFDEVGSARIDRWINRAYQRICDREAWPFLETTTTGAAPLTISDVRAVLSVIDTTKDYVLEWDDERTIRERDPSLAATGNPDSYYLDGSDIKVFPIATNDLSVRYIKFPDELTDDSHEPVVPSRYHYVIVDFAVCEAYKDSDNLEAWQILRDDVEEQLAEMANTLLVPNFSNPAQVVGGVHDTWLW